jgi:hypothetical protein
VLVSAHKGVTARYPARPYWLDGAQAPQMRVLPK